MPKLFHKGGANGVFLAVPSYGNPAAGFTHSLFETAKACEREGISVEFALLNGNCHVDDSRNILVQKFLESKCEKLFFIDADMQWSPESFIRLVESDKDVVAATYPYKQNEEGYPVAFLPGETQTDDQGWLEVLAVPTGFLCIKRHVFETLAAEAEIFHSKQDDGDIPLIFERETHNGHRRGGDYAFCRKWREYGEIYIDPEIELEHYGETSWTGSLASHRRTEEHGPLLARLKEIQQGKDTNKTYLDLVKAWGNDWSADAVMVAACVEVARKSDKDVLEAGSGITTLAMAAANPNIDIHSLEHDPQWVDIMFKYAREFKLTNIVLHYAPITDYDGYQGYEEYPEGDWGLVVCDGPPRRFGREGLFKQTKINGAIVIADDAEDPRILSILEDYRDQSGKSMAVHGQKDRKIAILH